MCLGGYRWGGRNGRILIFVDSLGRSEKSPFTVKIPRKGGPGITQTDLLVINKTDLAEAVGADLKVMERDTKKMRDDGPFVFAQVKHGVGVDEIVAHILHQWQHLRGIPHKH